MTEKRKFLRFDAIFDILHELLGGNPVKDKFRLRNVSREGLGISFRNALPKGAMLELEMIPPGDDMPIVAFGEVLWSKKITESRYDSGMRFTKIKSEDKMKLLDYAYGEWIKAKR